MRIDSEKRRSGTADEYSMLIARGLLLLNGDAANRDFELVVCERLRLRVDLLLEDIPQIRHSKEEVRIYGFTEIK